MSARRKARKRALDFLYEADLRGTNALELYLARGSDELAQEAYVEKLLRGVAEHQNKLHELIMT